MTVGLQEVKFRIYNSTLDPNIWDENMNLNPQVKVKLLKVAKDFYCGTELKTPVIDILFLGSTANYNWTSTSDIDLHIVIDISKENIGQEHTRQFLDGLVGNWNKTHNVEIKSHPVEVYLQDKTERNSTPELSRRGSSMYSVLKDCWLKKPDRTEIVVDKEKIKQKYNKIKSMVDEFVTDKNVDKLKKLMKALKNYRNTGLEHVGEFSTENLVFKALRHTNVITKLKDSINKIYDKSVSLSESQKKSLYNEVVDIDKYLVVGLINRDFEIVSERDWVGSDDSSNPLVTHEKLLRRYPHFDKDWDGLVFWRYKKSTNTLYWLRSAASSPTPHQRYEVLSYLNKKYGSVKPIETTDQTGSHQIDEMMDKKSNLFLGFIRRDNFKVIGTSIENPNYTHFDFQYALGPSWRVLSDELLIPWRYKRSTNTIYYWLAKKHPTEDEKEQIEYWLEKNVNIKYPKHKMISNYSPENPEYVKDRWDSHEINEGKFNPFKSKNLEFVTYGGLSLTKQKGYESGGEGSFHAPPARKGIYAFVWPYIERFLLGGSYADPKKRGKHQRQRIQYVRDKEGNVIDSDHPDYEKYSEIPKNWTMTREKPSSEYPSDWEDKDYGNRSFQRHILYRNAYRKKFKYNGPLWHHLEEFVKEDKIIDRKGDWVKTDMDTFKEALKKELHRVMDYDREINKGKPFRGLGISSNSWDQLEVFIDSKI